MIVDRDAQQAPGFCNTLGNLDVRATGLGIATGMVVYEDQRGRSDVQRLADDLARMDCRFIDSAIAHVVVEDQSVLRVEIEHTYAFDREVSHVDGQIIEERLPAAEYRLVFHHTPGHPSRRKRNGMERGGTRFAHSPDLAQCPGFGIEHCRKRTEMRDQCLGEWLGVALPDGRKQKELQQLIVGQRLASALQQALTKPFAVAGP